MSVDHGPHGRTAPTPATGDPRQATHGDASSAAPRRGGSVADGMPAHKATAHQPGAMDSGMVHGLATPWAHFFAAIVLGVWLAARIYGVPALRRLVTGAAAR